MNLYATCTNMIPAERCLVVIYPSIGERRRLHDATDGPTTSVGTIQPLEEHGVDEIDCGWSGQLEVVGGETPTTWWARGDCPRCGQVIALGADGTVR